MQIKKLPGSGEIGLNAIGVEFEDPAPVNINETPREILWKLDDTLANKPVKFSYFYGKQNTVFLTISGAHKQLNIDSMVNAMGKGHVLQIIVDIDKTARIGSNSSAIPAIQTGDFGNGSTSAIMWLNIASGALIYGRGGNGSVGGRGNNYDFSQIKGTRGDNGGDAIVMNGAGTLHLNNEGVIAGGGGGGGGGGAYVSRNPFRPGVWTGYGGKGGDGNIRGADATGGDDAYPFKGGAGGEGGALGEDGEEGKKPRSYGAKGEILGEGGERGVAGYAVRKSSGTTVYDKVGDIRGIRE